MKGSLAEGVLPGLLRSLYVARKSGSLHFVQGGVRRSVRFHHGQIVRGESTAREEHLGETMVRRGQLSEADLARATEIVIRDKKRLGLVLHELQLVDDDKLQDALSTQTHEILLKVFSEPAGEFEFEEASGDLPVQGDLTLKVSTGEIILEAVDRVRDPEIVRVSLGDLNRVLALPTDPLLRFQKVTLTPTDGYILSRVDGVMSAREIIQMLGLPEDDVCRSLLGLLSTGLVEYRAGATRPVAGQAVERRKAPEAPAPSAPTTPPPAAPRPPVNATAAGSSNAPSPPPAAPGPAPAPAPPAPASAPPPPPKVDTVEERRREILDAWNGIKTRTHYEVLGLPNDATAAQVKEAYVRLAKRLHPDVHTDPALADLRDKLEAVFIRLGQAYQALKDVKPRAVPAPPAPPPAAASPAPPEAPSAPPPPVKLDPRQVHEGLVKADRAYGQEKYWDAIQLVEGVLPHAEGKHLSRARIQLAKCFMKNPNWIRRAEEQLQLVIEKDRKNVDAPYLLATIYKGGGLKSRAISMLRRVLEIEPTHEGANVDLHELAPPQEDSPPQNEGFLKKLFGKG